MLSIKATAAKGVNEEIFGGFFCVPKNSKTITSMPKSEPYSRYKRIYRRCARA